MALGLGFLSDSPPKDPTALSAATAPPACISGLAAEMLPLVPPEDVDGDGFEDFGAATVHALDLIEITEPADTAGLSFSINFDGEPADREQTELLLTCKHKGSHLLEIWHWDAEGNGDFCNTYLLVSEGFVHCGDGADPVMTGVIAIEELAGVANAEVAADENGFATKTREDGTYLINYWDPSTYTLAPKLDTLPLNGVTTFDLVLISKHVLGIQSLDSPYKMIAADVNGSGHISIMDLIELRRLLLHIDDRFQNNASWRFIPALYQFPDPSDPWVEEYPEVIHVNDTDQNMLTLDFVAIKIGDVSLDADTNP